MYHVRAHQTDHGCARERLARSKESSSSRPSIHNHLLVEETSVFGFAFHSSINRTKLLRTGYQRHRMKQNRTSGRPLFCLSICGLLVFFAVLGTAKAKRGCSAFGHSCFGGHGKRFDPNIRDNELQESLIIGGKSQEVTALDMSNEFPFPKQKFGREPEILLPITQRQASSGVDPYTLSVIVRRWIACFQECFKMYLLICCSLFSCSKSLLGFV